MATSFQRWPFLFKPNSVRWYHPDVSRETPAVPVPFYGFNRQQKTASIEGLAPAIKAMGGYAAVAAAVQSKDAAKGTNDSDFGLELDTASPCSATRCLSPEHQLRW